MLALYNQARDFRILEGHWVVSVHESNGANSRKEIYVSSDGHYFTIDSFGKKDHVFNITDFRYDQARESIFFIKERINQPASYSQGRFKYNVNRLRQDDLPAGEENGSSRISYKRNSLNENLESAHRKDAIGKLKHLPSKL